MGELILNMIHKIGMNGDPRTDPLLGVPVSEVNALGFDALPSAPFGVVLTGLEWTAPTEETGRLFTVALRRHLLVVLRGQTSPSNDEMDTFFGALGRLVLDTEDGRQHYRGHADQEGPASEMALESRQYMSRSLDNTGSTYYTPGSGGMSELVWHNDQSHRPMLKVLSALEAQSAERDAVPTEFRDTYTAYETLPAELASALTSRQVVYYDPRLPGPEESPRFADANHPVFTAHPHTGRKAVFVNDFADRITGMNRDESDTKLSDLRAHLDACAPRYTHRWLPGDIVVWDNIGIQHRRGPVPPNQVRRLRQYGGLAE
jgi:alpha-ketoglutarate-dependent taurine dioxygenase